MPSDVFNALYRERVDIFKAGFCNVSQDVFFDATVGRLRHSGEFGMYRESIVRDFLKFVVPARLRISNGFVITGLNDVSTQCDVIIFNPELSPLFQSAENQRLFPVESVCCVVEVKSTLSKTDFTAAINKLASVKALSERIATPVVRRKHNPIPFNPVNDPSDLVTTVLICRKLNFDLSKIDVEMNSLYHTSVLPRHKHNLILSVDDGLLLYFDKSLNPIPSIEQRVLDNCFVFPDENPYCHFYVFLTSMHILMNTRTEIMPELGQHAGELEGGKRSAPL
jgi:hypothetical protein